MNNNEVLEKTITAATSLASGGKLPNEYAEKIADYIFDQAVLKPPYVRTHKFRADQYEIHKLAITGRVLMPATEDTAPAFEKDVTGSKITIAPKEMMAYWAVSSRALDINVEGMDFKDHVLRMMSNAASNNLEEAKLLGDVLGPAILESEYKQGGGSDYVKDELYGQWDGFFRKGDSGHVYDHANAKVNGTLFSNMIDALPDKYKKNYDDLFFLIPPSVEQYYRLWLAARATPLGDEVLGKKGEIPVFGIGALRCPLLPKYPVVVEHLALPAETEIQMRYKPIYNSGDEKVLPSTLGSTATTPFVKDTDYAINYTTGKINRIATGSIGDGDTVKVTYHAMPQCMLTLKQNLIFGIGRDMTIETDRDITKRRDLVALHMVVAVNVEETDALVKAINIQPAADIS